VGPGGDRSNLLKLFEQVILKLREQMHEQLPLDLAAGSDGILYVQFKASEHPELPGDLAAAFAWGSPAPKVITACNIICSHSAPPGNSLHGNEKGEN
jgi:hypothetical protein